MPDVDGHRRSGECPTVEPMPKAEAACEFTSAYSRRCHLWKQYCQVPWTSSTARTAMRSNHTAPVLYIVDDSKACLAPAIGGYDLMKSGRMVLDIDNQLLWSRLTHSLTEQPSLPLVRLLLLPSPSCRLSSNNSQNQRLMSR